MLGFGLSRKVAEENSTILVCFQFVALGRRHGGF